MNLAGTPPPDYLSSVSLNQLAASALRGLREAPTSGPTLETKFLVSFAPLNTQSVRDVLQSDSLFLQTLDHQAIKLGPLKGDNTKTLVGNARGQLREEYHDGPCDYYGDSYWMY